MNRLFVGRELKIVGLKKVIEELETMKEPSTIIEGGFGDPNTESILRRLILICISITAGISSIAIIGWVSNWLLLARIRPNYFPMAQSTALTFIILSLALFVYARKPKHLQAMIFVKVAVFFVLIYNLIILIDFFIGAGLDIEQILYPQPENFDNFPIGRMSPLATVNFLLSAFSLLLLLISPSGWHRAKNAASYLAFIVVSAGLIIVLGYLYGSPLLYGGTIIPVALTTAIAFVFMGIGLIAAAGGHYFPVSSFVGSSLQPRLMRAFIPVTIVIILINGFLDVVILQFAENYVLALSLSAIFSVILVGIVISKMVRTIGGSIDRAEGERKRAEEGLRDSEAMFSTIYNRSPLLITISDLENGKYLEVNDSFCKVSGFSREEAIGKTSIELGWISEEGRSKLVKELKTRGVIIGKELELRNKKGKKVVCRYYGDIIKVKDQNRLLSTAEDITEQKHAEELIKKNEMELEEAQRIGKLGSWSWDAATDRIIWSDEYYRIYGFDPAQPTPCYEEHLKAYTPDSAEKLDAAVKRNMETGETYELDLELANKEGKTRWITARSETIRDTNGNIIGLRGTAQDISERKRAEEKLQKANRIYLVISQIDQAVVRLHEKEEILSEACRIAVEYGKFRMAWIGMVDERTKLVNPVAYSGVEDGYLSKIKKISIEDVPEGRGPTGTSIRENRYDVCNDIEKDPRMAPSKEEALKRGYRSSISFTVKHLGKVIGAFTLYASVPHFFDEEEIRLLDEVTNDISYALDSIEMAKKKQEAEVELRKHRDQLEQLVKERTALITTKTEELNENQMALTSLIEEMNIANSKLAQAKERAEAADRLKSVFLATMSHELRTPLNSIIGFTGIILQGFSGPINDEQKKQLEMVKNSGNHLLSLINDVLDISKIEAGQFKVERSRFEMRKVIDTVINIVKPLAENQGLALHVEVAPDVGEVISDRRRVEQVLFNLLSNAIKFTEKGEVKVECKVIDGQVMTRVIDTGIGIKPQNMTNLFKPFVQLENGLSRRFEGTGLGLSINKKIVEALGGRIWAESEFGKGSVFTFTIPIKKDAT